MPRHAAPPTVPDEDTESSHFPILTVMAMLCITAVITAMSLSGNSHDAGGVACAAIMCATVVLLFRRNR